MRPAARRRPGTRVGRHSGRLAAAAGGAGSHAIFACGAEGSGKRQVSRLGGINVYPSRSPDGSPIAFRNYTNAEQPGDLRIIGASGANPRRAASGRIRGRVHGDDFGPNSGGDRSDE